MSSTVCVALVIDGLDTSEDEVAVATIDGGASEVTSGADVVFVGAAEAMTQCPSASASSHVLQIVM